MAKKVEAPLLSAEDNVRSEAAVVATIAKLDDIARKEGLQAAIAEAIGLSFAVAHVFKKLGLIETHRNLRKDLATFVGKGDAP